MSAVWRQAIEALLRSSAQPMVLVEKLVGAAIERGADLQACKALGDRITENSSSMGVAPTSCTVPANGRPNVEIGTTEMEVGVGIHGEPGRRRDSLKPADAIAEDLVAAICDATGIGRGDPVLLLVNGMGGSPLMELYLMHDAAARQCDARGIKVVRLLVGNYYTSLDMVGCSITLTRLADDLVGLWDAPVRTAALCRGV